MTPNFKEERATQLASMILKMRGGKMHYLKLIKLMYLIDREALLRWGWSMTRDKYVSMDNGCVLSRTYSLIREETLGASYWKKFISEPQGWQVSLLAEPEFDELSKAEVGLIEEIYKEFGHWNRWKLVDYTHSLPEWTDPKGSSIPIEYKEVMKAVGKSDQEIAETMSELEEEALFEHLVKA